jgi:hypothetical protein
MVMHDANLNILTKDIDQDFTVLHCIVSNSAQVLTEGAKVDRVSDQLHHFVSAYLVIMCPMSTFLRSELRYCDSYYGYY